MLIKEDWPLCNGLVMVKKPNLKIVNFLKKILRIFMKKIELYNLPIETLLKASKILEQSGKVQVIEIEPGQFGLKFL